MLASCHQLTDVRLMITGEWWISGWSNMAQCYRTCPQRYRTCPPWEHTWMTGTFFFFGGLNRKMILFFFSFAKEELRRHFLGHWGIRRKAIAQMRFLTVNIWKHYSLSEGLGIISYLEISGNLSLAFYPRLAQSRHVKAESKGKGEVGLTAVCQHFFLAC